MAGLVHVGCAESMGRGHLSEGQTETHGCVCHEHVASSEDLGEAAQPTSHDTEHDADDCSVCQSFFAARHAIVTLFQSTVWEPLPTERTCIERNSNTVVAAFIYGLSVRGPPHA